ncbi:spermidine/putrescine ABC transporter [Tabrizicola sp. TH137]|uniref:ABC transporter permease n=1 Tax=Tabrizicola sp. TH137 TaxID=2067452 RepID=UPI000C7D8A6E|nr:spermidine/putrescine ABC transporter [Tabrizicola sp. TH137]
MTPFDSDLRPAPAGRPSLAVGLRNRVHRSEALRGYLLLSPALAVLGVAIIAPLILLIVMSTWSMSGFDMLMTPGLGNYAIIASDPIYAALLGRSLKIAAIATAATVLLSYPVAYFVAFHVHRHKMLWLILLTLPFWTSYLMRIFAWRVVLGYEGVINSALMSLGLIEAPMQVFLYSQTAVTIALAHAWAAFAILPIYVSLEKIDKSYLEAAADLGDNAARRFWRITLPLSLPGVVAAFFLMFIPTVGDYVTAAMLGGPDGMMVGNLIQAQFGPINDWPMGAALALVMTLAVAVAGLAFLLLTRMIRR